MQVQILGSEPAIEMMGLNEFGQPSNVPDWWQIIGWTVATASAAASAYHGYKRNDSAGWAIGWGVFGFVLPILAVPISLAQGFGKPKE